MQQSWKPNYTNSIFQIQNDQRLSSKNAIQVVLENAVVILVRRGCCMGHVVRQLLLTHGANPLIHEVADEAKFMDELNKMMIVHCGSGRDEITQLPAVFIGGNLFGGLEKIMAAHIRGDLMSLLKQAGALWL